MNEATVKQITKLMHREGFTRIRALTGGLDAWERHGYPLEPLTLQTDAAGEPLHLPRSFLKEDEAVTL